MGKKRYERQVLLAKEESTEGQDANPVAGDAIAVMESIPPSFDPQLIERAHPADDLGRLKPLIGARNTKFSFKTEYYGSGAVDTAPRLGDLLEACGFGETINVGTSVVYAPVSEGQKTDTIYQYIDGLLYKSFGSVGSFKVGGKVGEPIMFEFEMTGLYQDDADAAIITPNFGSNYASPPQALQATFTLDSITTFILREFNLDMGIPIINRESFAGTAGFAGFAVGKRNPTGNIIIELESKATKDFLADFEASNQIDAVIDIGSDVGNRISFALKLTYTNFQIEDADGLATINIPIALNKSAGNDDIVITCT